jgi:hypothetical protein
VNRSAVRAQVRANGRAGRRACGARLRLAQFHAALLAGARGDVETARTASILRATVEAGPRPMRRETLEELFTRHRPSKLTGVPVEIAVLGVNEVLERFGWPTQLTPPHSRDGYWSLMYNALEVRTADGVIPWVQLNCTREGTFHISCPPR